MAVCAAPPVSGDSVDGDLHQLADKSVVVADRGDGLGQTDVGEAAEPCRVPR